MREVALKLSSEIADDASPIISCFNCERRNRNPHLAARLFPRFVLLPCNRERYFCTSALQYSILISARMCNIHVQLAAVVIGLYISRETREKDDTRRPDPSTELKIKHAR